MVVRALKTVFRIEAVIQYCLLSDNCKATENYIPANYGFLFSADGLWDLWLLWGQVEGCQTWSGLLVSPPSCLRDELVLIQLHPACCFSSLGCTGSFKHYLCLKSCRKFSVLIPLASCQEQGRKTNWFHLIVVHRGCSLIFYPPWLPGFYLDKFLSASFCFLDPSVIGEAKLNRHDGKKV